MYTSSFSIEKSRNDVDLEILIGFLQDAGFEYMDGSRTVRLSKIDVGEIALWKNKDFVELRFTTENKGTPWVYAFFSDYDLIPVIASDYIIIGDVAVNPNGDIYARGRLVEGVNLSISERDILYLLVNNPEHKLNANYAFARLYDQVWIDHALENLDAQVSSIRDKLGIRNTVFDIRAMGIGGKDGNFYYKMQVGNILTKEKYLENLERSDSFLDKYVKIGNHAVSPDRILYVNGVLSAKPLKEMEYNLLVLLATNIGEGMTVGQAYKAVYGKEAEDAATAQGNLRMTFSKLDGRLTKGGNALDINFKSLQENFGYMLKNVTFVTEDEYFHLK
jgi:DNA-binding response OmpR family regulator